MIHLSPTASGVPGISGIPANAISVFASTLSPLLAIVSADGPMKTSSLSSHALTKAGRSDRNPQPGWTASQRIVVPAAMTDGMFR